MDTQSSTLNVGLRIDVDTLRGTELGVPTLLGILAKRGIRASLFFSVGPDNMGRHLWRLIRPKFLVKMLRSNAASLYGWDILLRGVFWPGPHIGRHCSPVMRRAAKAGHEVGLHAWDHHKWQRKLTQMSASQITNEIDMGLRNLTTILGYAPRCSAAAGWRCNETVLIQKERHRMNYNSDCRGVSLFRPIAGGVALAPQVPVTLPTYDELIGRNGVTDANYNSILFDHMRPNELNVLTIHAEVEGIVKSRLFEEFLDEAETRRITFSPLGKIVEDTEKIPTGTIAEATISGRDGPVCVQVSP